MNDTTALLSFLNESPTAYHTVRNIKEELLNHGARELKETEAWNLTPGTLYYVIRNDSSVISFHLPEGTPKSFMIGASHSDSPAFKVKPNPEMEQDGLVRLNVERYGGMLLAPWFDRPLSLAGRVAVRTKHGVETKLINIRRDLMVIPSLAIHMDREVNEGHPLKIQKELLPILRESGSKETFLSLLAKEAEVKESDILSHDIYLYPRTGSTVFGANEEFIGSMHLDDLQCTFSSLSGFVQAENPDSIPVLAVFDNEEVGSLSRQGASGTFLEDVLERIGECLGLSRNAYLSLVANSYMISADNVHAAHPNYPEKADPINRPKLNGGIVIKYAGNQSYTTDGISSALFKELCRRHRIPVQEYSNHADIRGGRTLGHLSLNHVSLTSVDIGLAQLAMHSPYEMCGVKDAASLIKAMKVFYSSSLSEKKDGSRSIQ